MTDIKNAYEDAMASYKRLAQHAESQAEYARQRARDLRVEATLMEEDQVRWLATRDRMLFLYEAEYEKKNGTQT